ncbi:MAG TPA: hypothetical protein VJS66_00530, partial [Burkholderiales bacterium]|nr:hypothetical protein [Burkholderiales bacterium]
MTIIVGGHETGLLDSSFTQLNRNDRNRAGGLGQGEETFVNVSNGNLLIQQRDAFLPSQGEDYALVRTYNARGVPSDAHEHDDARWTFSTSVRLTKKNGGEYYEVEYGDGSVFEFRYDAARGLYVSVDGAGAYETLRNLNVNGNDVPAFVLTRANQSQLSFDKHGKLLSSVDTNGVRVDYHYASDRLVRVNDDQGHLLHYVYQQGKLARVTDENEGTVVEYRYQSGRLSEVIDRFGHSTKYFYTNDG